MSTTSLVAGALARWERSSGAQRRVAVGSAALVAALVLVGLFALQLRTSGLVDFEAYYEAGKTVLAGGRLYARGLAWKEVGFAVNVPHKIDPCAGRLPYVYPPAFALALVPFAALPFGLASSLWELIVYACFIGTAYVLLGVFSSTTRSTRFALALIVSAVFTAFQPVRASTHVGQADCILLFMLALTISDFVKGRELRSGLWLALAASIKPTLAFLLIFFVWKRAYRGSALICAVGATLLIVPAAILGKEVILDFMSVAGYWSSPAFAVSPVNQSPYGLLLRLFTENAFTAPLLLAPPLVLVLRVAIAALTMTLLARGVSRSQTVPAPLIALEFSAAIVAMLLVGPLSEDIQYIYLVIPMMTVAATLSLEPSRLADRLAGGLLAVFAYLSLPKLHAMKFAFYAHYTAPIAGAKVLLTGVHVYALVAFAALIYVQLTRLAAGSPSCSGRLTDEAAA